MPPRTPSPSRGFESLATPWSPGSSVDLANASTEVHSATSTDRSRNGLRVRHTIEERQNSNVVAPSRLNSPESASSLGQPQTPPLNIRSLEYVAPYDDNLDCPICQGPLVDPAVTRCKHIFCGSCIKRSLETNPTCPIDRRILLPTGFDVHSAEYTEKPPLVILNQLDNLTVKCPNRRCGHTCARHLVAYHYMNTCPFTKVPCPVESCMKLVAREHTSAGICQHRTVACGFCDKIVEEALMDDHHDNDCNQEVPCEDCGSLQRSLAIHGTVCLDRKIFCKHQAVGCDYETTGRCAEQLEKHESRCIYGVVVGIKQAHNKEIEEVKRELHETQKRLHTTEKNLRKTKKALRKVEEASRYKEVASSPAHDSELLSQNIEHPPPLSRVTIPTVEARIEFALHLIDIHDAKLEDLYQHIGDLKTGQSEIAIHHIGRMDNQIIEFRSVLTQLGMTLRSVQAFSIHHFKQLGVIGVAAAPGGGGDNAQGGEDEAAAWGLPLRRRSSDRGDAPRL